MLSTDISNGNMNIPPSTNLHREDNVETYKDNPEFIKSAFIGIESYNFSDIAPWSGTSHVCIDKN